MRPIPLRRRLKKALGSATGILLTSFVAVVIVMSITISLGPRIGRYRILTVLSSSMAPKIPKGSLIVVHSIPLQSIQVGDVLTFWTPGVSSILETHRVSKILKPGLQPIVQTKGDANSQPDPWSIRLLTEPGWKLSLTLPGAGYIFQQLRTPVIQFFTIAMAPVALAIIWLRDIWRPNEKG